MTTNTKISTKKLRWTELTGQDNALRKKKIEEKKKKEADEKAKKEKEAAEKKKALEKGFGAPLPNLVVGCMAVYTIFISGHFTAFSLAASDKADDDFMMNVFCKQHMDSPVSKKYESKIHIGNLVYSCEY